MSFQISNGSSSSQEEIHPSIKHPHRLSKSDSQRERPEPTEVLATTVPFTAKKERSLSNSDKFSPRSFEKSSPPKQLKSSSKKSFNKAFFKGLLENDKSFPIVAIEDIRFDLHKQCLGSLEKIAIVERDHLLGWFQEQVKKEKNELAQKSHLWTNYELKIQDALRILDAACLKETTKKIEQLRKFLKELKAEVKDCISLDHFAFTCISSINNIPIKHKKDLLPIFHKIFAGDEKHTNDLLSFLAKWSRDPISSGELTIAAYNSYLSKQTFQVLSGSFQSLDELGITLIDIKRHLIKSDTIQVKKIVVNKTPINILDLIEENGVLKKNCTAIFYKRVISAIIKNDLPHEEVEEFISASRFSDLSSPTLIKTVQLLKAGTINFFGTYPHKKFLGLLNEDSSVKIVSERGTTWWDIQVDHDEFMSLNQIKSYRVQKLSNDDCLLAVNLQCLTTFDFKASKIESQLTISGMAPKEKISHEEMELLLKLLA